MSPLVILAILVTAFFTGPTAFLFLWLAYVKTGERTLRTISFSMIGLSLILLGNSASFILVNFFRIYDARIGFLVLNEAFLAAIMTSGFILRFAYEASKLRITSAHRTAFWLFTVLSFFLAISLSLFLVSGDIVDVRRGYLVSTVYATICQVYATVILVARRERLAPMYRRAVPPLFLSLIPLGVTAIMNDFFHFGTTLGGPEIPFSPLFFIFMNIFIVVLCVKSLLNVEVMKKNGTAVPDLGFSDREREIVPLIIQGLSNEEIADKLFISPHTVKNHVTNIFRKSNVTNRFELLKSMNSSE